MAKPIFYDPDPRRRRWTRLRRLFDVLGAAITGLILFFIVSIFFEQEQLPRILKPAQKHSLRALKERESKRKTKARGTHRKTEASPSEVELNADEGIRAAYYVTWDAASFVSLKEYYPQ